MKHYAGMVNNVECEKLHMTMLTNVREDSRRRGEAGAVVGQHCG